MEIIYHKSEIIRQKPLNFDQKDDPIFKQVWNSIRPECHLLRLENIYVVKDTLLDPYKLTFYDKYTHFHGYGNLHKFKKIVRWIKNGILNKTVKIDKGVWICNRRSGNYFHWFMDCIPRLLITEKYLDGHIIILPESFKSYPFIKESLEFMKKKAIYVSPHINYKISNILLPNEIGKIDQYRIELLEKLKTNFIQEPKNIVGFRRVFLMRKPAKARNILNRDAIIEILKEYKYEIHYFEDYALLKQLKIIKETKILAGLHGAGLTNMVFMPPGGTVLEFRNGEDGSAQVNCFFTLASELGINYFYTTNKSTESKTNDSDFEIDLIKLRKALEDIECRKF